MPWMSIDGMLDAMDRLQSGDPRLRDACGPARRRRPRGDSAGRGALFGLRALPRQGQPRRWPIALRSTCARQASSIVSSHGGFGPVPPAAEVALGSDRGQTPKPQGSDPNVRSSATRQLPPPRSPLGFQPPLMHRPPPMATNGSGVLHVPSGGGALDPGVGRAGAGGAGAVAGGSMPGGSHPPFQHVPPPIAENGSGVAQEALSDGGGGTTGADGVDGVAGGATLSAGGAMPGGSHPPL